MIQTNTNKVLWWIAGLLAVIAMGIWSIQMAQKTFSSAPIGLPATITDFQQVAVGLDGSSGTKGAGTILTYSTPFCSARIITTYANPIMLKFSSSTISNGVATSVPFVSGRFGHLQAASTTQVYDSGLWGCGGINAFGFDATTSIQFTELR